MATEASFSADASDTVRLVFSLAVGQGFLIEISLSLIRWMRSRPPLLTAPAEGQAGIGYRWQYSDYH